MISRERQHAHTHDDGGGGSNRMASDISGSSGSSGILYGTVVVVLQSSQVQGYSAAALHARQPDCATSLLFFVSVIIKNNIIVCLYHGLAPSHRFVKYSTMPLHRRSAAERMRWTVLWCTIGENQKTKNHVTYRTKKRDTKDRGDVVAMTVNKCVRAETVRLNTAKQTCYHNNNYYIIIIIRRFISVVNDLVNRTEYTVQYVQQ
ncbi:hypothetical protein AGLY_004998 [Aphis glycines]|uniref:Uncharacterized protein n=1 Tax=Aphis glycines TaxID=307491 RepID=A0A6G0TWR8_APHGL|nr:hypothetical protein AGLY_004998 [Aphis glycines]